MVYFLKEQKAQQRRAATQRDLPRELLLPRHYKSFVEVENKLWAAAEGSERSKWNTGRIRLRGAEAQIVREYVRGLRQDFAQGNRIFSVLIGHSPDAKIFKELEVQRLKIAFPYRALSVLVRSRLLTDRVSMKELRQLTDAVATMAFEVRSMVNTLERLGHVDFVESLLRNY